MPPWRRLDQTWLCAKDLHDSLSTFKRVLELKQNSSQLWGVCALKGEWGVLRGFVINVEPTSCESNTDCITPSQTKKKAKHMQLVFKFHLPNMASKHLNAENYVWWRFCNIIIIIIIIIICFEHLNITIQLHSLIVGIFSFSDFRQYLWIYIEFLKKNFGVIINTTIFVSLFPQSQAVSDGGEPERSGFLPPDACLCVIVPHKRKCLIQSHSLSCFSALLNMCVWLHAV